MKKIFLLSFLFPALMFAQNVGYFGNKNMLTLHGSAFFRAWPQTFYPYTKDIYAYDEQADALKRRRLNIGWNTGVTYRRVVGRLSAFGVRYDFNTRLISDPYYSISGYNSDDNLDNYFRPVFGKPSHASDLTYNYATPNGGVANLHDVKASATYMNIHSFSLVYSFNINFGFMPLGVVSSLGIGGQLISMDMNRDYYLNYEYLDVSDQAFGKRIDLIAPPTDFENKYLGILAFWDLSINYPLSKNLILEFASEIRSSFFFQMQSDFQGMRDFFPTDEFDRPMIESSFFARDMRRELLRELYFNNTFRLGLTFVF